MTAGEENHVLGAAALAGLRVLVAEDRGLIAARVAQILLRAGCVLAGSAPTVAEGLDMAAREDGALGAAVLDIDLRGEPAYPLAEALRARGVPFLFLTGYGQPAIPERWRDAPRLEKPFDAPALLRALDGLVAARAPASPRAAAGPAGEPPPRPVGGVWADIRRQRNLIMEARIRCEAASVSGVKAPKEG